MFNSFPKTYTAGEIISCPQKGKQFIIKDILPFGLTMICAAPKTGKSVLATQIGTSTVIGNPFWGMYEVQKSGCLHLTFEETLADISPRLQDIPMSRWDGYEVCKEWRTNPRGGLVQLEDWLKLHPETKLVIIDVYGGFRGDESGGFNYRRDYKELAPIKKVADSNNAAIVLLHHTVKKPTKDWVTSLYGSAAIAAACDCIMYIDRERGMDDATLRLTGRGMPDQNIEILLNREKVRWDFIGKLNQAEMPEERQDVLLVLAEVKGPLRLKQIAEEVRKGLTNTQKLLKRLVYSGFVTQVKYGFYQLTPKGENYLTMLLS